MRRRSGPDAVDAGHAARPWRLRRLRPPAERRRRRRLPAPPHDPAPCGATTASRHTNRRTPTCGPCSAAAARRLTYRNPRKRTRPETRRPPGSEADLAEGAPAEPQVQDDHLAADGAAGLEPWALDEAAELDPAADTVRFVLHRGADRLTVDVEPGHDPERPVIAAMQASDPGAQRGHNRRPRSAGSGQRAPLGSSPTATARAAEPPQPEPATLRFGRLAARPAWRKPGGGGSRADEQTRGGHLDHGGTTGIDGVSATTATATSSSSTRRPPPAPSWS